MISGDKFNPNAPSDEKSKSNKLNGMKNEKKKAKKHEKLWGNVLSSGKAILRLRVWDRNQPDICVLSADETFAQVLQYDISDFGFHGRFLFQRIVSKAMGAKNASYMKVYESMMSGEPMYDNMPLYRSDGVCLSGHVEVTPLTATFMQIPVTSSSEREDEPTASSCVADKADENDAVLDDFILEWKNEDPHDYHHDSHDIDEFSTTLPSTESRYMPSGSISPLSYSAAAVERTFSQFITSVDATSMSGGDESTAEESGQDSINIDKCIDIGALHITSSAMNDAPIIPPGQTKYACITIRSGSLGNTLHFNPGFLGLEGYQGLYEK